ncbi:DeoR/GlpR family DNA-binding transcription regulator [Alicyclobacillus ferrooxydans]|uniref:DeoR/GlpR family DNA-binding transcription regulator n=1 Tax=Alicyclobacillus ferrooxydans TaxID=471514 RepID=UPI0006D57EE3|nr:DeoR/GlpR family DNA-binding transcription regulator [Alicyclobacillus ferrooxydans]
MYPAERRQALMKLINERGFVSISDLAERLDVSEITIRRDLNYLEREGLVEKVAGGGRMPKSTMEPAFLNKRILQQTEKSAIAQAALQRIEPGMTLGLSAGTTTWALAQQVKPGAPNLDHLTFVTNSTNIATVLQANGWSDILLLGGQFRTPSDALIGPLAEENARRLHTDLLFLGVHGADLAYGLTTPNLQEAAINRVMMEQTESVVAVFDHTKWGIRALAHLAHFEEVDVVITNINQARDELSDADPSQSEISKSAELRATVDELRKLGPEVVIAQVD